MYIYIYGNFIEVNIILRRCTEPYPKLMDVVVNCMKNTLHSTVHALYYKYINPLLGCGKISARKIILLIMTVKYSYYRSAKCCSVDICDNDCHFCRPVNGRKKESKKQKNEM